MLRSLVRVVWLALVASAAAAADEPCGALSYDFKSGFEHSESFTVTLPPANTALAIAIDARFVGMVTDEASIDLDGTHAGPPNTGIASVWLVGRITGSEWQIESIPLSMGSNTLTVVASDLEGNTASAVVTIQRVAADASALLFSVDSDDGHAPRIARFRFRIPANRTLVQLQLDADGNGQYEQTLPTADVIATHRYADPGRYVASARFSLDDGDSQTPVEVVTRSSPVVINNLERTRKTLCYTFGQLKARLIASNIVGAKNALVPKLRTGFENVWTNLGPELATFAAGLGQIATGSIGTEFAELVVVRPSTIQPGEQDGFRIQFDRGRDGVWRIGGM